MVDVSIPNLKCNPFPPIDRPLFFAHFPWIVVLCCLGFLFRPSIAAAQTTEVVPQSERNQLLLVLRVATNAVQEAREQRFVMELALALEGITIKEVVINTPNFGAAGFGEQIGIVRPLITDNQAVAATWLEPVSEELVILHTIAVSSGQALARMVEVVPTEGVEADLAMAARELLRTVFLFGEMPASQNAPENNNKAVSKSETAPKDTPAAPLPLHPPNWRIRSYGKIEGGIIGHEGPSVQFGGAFSLDRRVFSGLYARLFAGARGGYPSFNANFNEDLKLRTFGLDAGAGILYIWRLPHVSVSPAVEMQRFWTHVRVSQDNEPKQTLWRSGNRISALLELTFHIHPFWAILLSGGVNAMAVRETYERTSNDATILTTPHLGWETRLGFVINF